MPEGAIGLRQSDALFQHTVRLHEKYQLCRRARCAPSASAPVPARWKARICPVFWQERASRGAFAFRAAFLRYPISRGHIAAAALSAGKLDLLDGEFLAWHLSGGTSELLYVKCGADGLPDCTCIGGTTDLAAGQLLDRAGNLLGLPFPSGGALDALALTAEPEKGFKPKVTDCKFSLSGMQNQVENKFKTAEPKEMARFALETVANAVIKATEQAREHYHFPILCAGGVMASQVIRPA